MARSALSALLTRQHSVASRRQLDDGGITDDHIRAQLAGRRWQELNGTVICLHNGPLTTVQVRWAAILSAQGPTALSGLTALDDAGVTGFATSATHVLVQRGSKVLTVPDAVVVVHESRRFDASDVIVTAGPPRTSLERATIDAAVWSRDLLTASRIVVAPVQQRRTTPARLLITLESAGQVRYRKVLHQLLRDLEGGAEALSEVEFSRWCRRHAFPTPRLQVRVDSNGRRRYLDAGFSRADGSRVLVEVDGGVHLSLATRWRDTSKDNDAALAGELTLRFPSVAIYSDDPTAIAQLRSALEPVRRLPRYGAA